MTDTISRIFSRAKVDGECWVWQGPSGTSGYCRVFWRGKNTYAHRIVAGLEPGNLLQADHLCRNARCVRPTHLGIMTQADHARKSVRSRTRD